MTSPHGVEMCSHCAGDGAVYYLVRYRYKRGTTNELIKEELERMTIPPNTPPMNYYPPGYSYPIWVLECGECTCRTMARQARQLEKSTDQDGVPAGKYDKYGWSDFDDSPKARDAALEFCRNDCHVTIDGVERPGLLFVGATGTHKTCLSYVIYRQCLSQGIQGAWWLTSALRKAEQDTYDEAFTGDRDTFIKACRTRLLILDDLGEKRPSGQVLETTVDRQEIMFRLFEHREAKALPTICTTNLKKDELYTHFGDRVASRILGLCHVIPMTGKDSRVHPFEK